MWNVKEGKHSMITENQAVILSNAEIARDVWKMELQTPQAESVKPGQFVMVEIPGKFLRRPISVSDTNGDVLTLIYKIMGKGTDLMSTMHDGESLNLVGPLGMGFPVVGTEEAVLLIGGGVGTPPLVKTAKAWLEKGKKVDVVLGFNSAPDVFGLDEFAQLGIEAIVATMDGTMGTKGTVLDAIREKGIATEFVQACGPLPMLRAVQSAYKKGYISLESRMGCGIGVCMGCIVNDTNGETLRVCKNGPVFPIGKVVL